MQVIDWTGGAIQRQLKWDCLWSSYVIWNVNLIFLLIVAYWRLFSPGWNLERRGSVRDSFDSGFTQGKRTKGVGGRFEWLVWEISNWCFVNLYMCSFVIDSCCVFLNCELDLMCSANEVLFPHWFTDLSKVKCCVFINNPGQTMPPYLWL